MDQNWQRVAEAVRARREEDLALTIEDAALSGPSKATWDVIEHARRPIGLSAQRKIAATLGWPGNAIARILEGEDPAGFADPTSFDALASRLADLEARVMRLENGGTVQRVKGTRTVDEATNDEFALAAGDPGDDLVTPADLDAGTSTRQRTTSFDPDVPDDPGDPE